MATRANVAKTTHKMPVLVTCYRCKKSVDEKKTALCSICKNRMEPDCDGYPLQTYRLKSQESKTKWRCSKCTKKTVPKNVPSPDDNISNNVTVRKKPAYSINHLHTDIYKNKRKLLSPNQDSHILSDYDTSCETDTNTPKRLLTDSLDGSSTIKSPILYYEMQDTIAQLTTKLECAENALECKTLQNNELNKQVEELTKEIKLLKTMTEAGFVKAQSDNLPKIDAFMMTAYFASNPDFTSAEIRGVKAARSTRESYGDSAVGYVQVKRDGDICVVKARITPEHNVRQKCYAVICTCNETEETILSVQCEDCAAHLGGCKHAIAFLAWLHRRSEDPSTTSIECYWKKSKLSSIGTSKKFIKAKEMYKTPKHELVPTSLNTESFLTVVKNNCTLVGDTKNHLMKFYRAPSTVEKLSIHHLLSTSKATNPLDFIEYCKLIMTADACKGAAIATLEQNDCPLWHELRYGRITASKAYDAAHCNTLDGTLTETILGASKLRDTEAMERGRLLESQVLKEVEKICKIKISKCGLKLNSTHPIMGASPDGENSVYSIEIKCPTSEKAMGRYVSSGNKVTAKYMAQVQLQMHFSNKAKALFCVADKDFEKTKKISILEVNYDQQLCENLLEKCDIFWNKAIFPKLNIFTSFLVLGVDFDTEGGRIRVHLLASSKHDKSLKPLSAITALLGVALPPYPSEIKLIKPSGVHEIKYFKVLHFLYCDQFGLILTCTALSHAMSSQYEKWKALPEDHHIQYGKYCILVDHRHLCGNPIVNNKNNRQSFTSQDIFSTPTSGRLLDVEDPTETTYRHLHKTIATLQKELTCAEQEIKTLNAQIQVLEQSLKNKQEQQQLTIKTKKPIQASLYDATCKNTIRVFGAQQCVGLAAALTRSRETTRYVKYDVRGETMPNALSDTIVKKCFSTKLCNDDKIIICLGENDYDMKHVLSQLKIFLQTYCSNNNTILGSKFVYT
ncbi:hypothetical protein HW555_006846 [Spodoptera exigua]|uniref:YqaJ viral recombinase domain-containing protein n=1 Tax=Spodoptera exigua TaxID=7107 RepID=A0A835GDV0_SPOEX|nr:hypothetical protein HW555_006846 [Spodoptera exigua]